MIGMLRAYFIKDPAKKSLMFADLGKKFFAKGRYERAGEAFGFGLRFAKEIKEPAKVATFFKTFHATHLGLVSGMQGFHGLATSWCEKALEYDPMYLKAHDLLVRSLVSEGRFDEAKREMERTLELNKIAEEPDPTLSSGLQILRDHLFNEGLWPE